MKLFKETTGLYSVNQRIGLIKDPTGKNKLFIIEDPDGEKWAEWDINNQEFIVIFKDNDTAVKHHSPYRKTENRSMPTKLVRVLIQKVK